MKVCFSGNIPLQFAALDSVYEEFLKHDEFEVGYYFDLSDTRYLEMNENLIRFYKSQNKNIVDINEFNPDITFISSHGAISKGKTIKLPHGLVSKGTFSSSYVLWRNKIDIYLLSSPYYKRLIEKYVDNQIEISGYPKSDKLFNKDYDVESLKKELGLSNNSKVILYAPTYHGELNSLSLRDEICSLAGKEIELIVKLHDVTYKEREFREYFLNKNVTLITHHDTTKYMPVADVMISDLSGILFGFLPCNKPIISYINPKRQEFESKMKERGEIEYPTLTFGDAFIECASFEEIKKNVESIFCGEDNNKSAREKAIHGVFSYQGKSAKQIIKIVKEKF